MGRYWKISYDGRDLMEIWARSQYEAKASAVRTYQREGRRGMNLALLEAR